MERMFGRPIVTQEQMRSRIRELGRQISADYAGKDLVLVGVLKGAYAFFADLARAIRIPVRVDFIIVTSYGTRAKTSGKVKLVTELTEKIKGKDVLLVEDIVDSGLTIQYLTKALAKRKPNSIKICTLLSKRSTCKWIMLASGSRTSMSLATDLIISKSIATSLILQFLIS